MIKNKLIPCFGLVEVSNDFIDTPTFQFTFENKTLLTKKIIHLMALISGQNISCEEVVFIDINYYSSERGVLSMHTFNRVGNVSGFYNFNKRYHHLIFQYIRILFIESC